MRSRYSQTAGRIFTSAWRKTALSKGTKKPPRRGPRKGLRSTLTIGQKKRGVCVKGEARRLGRLKTAFQIRGYHFRGRILATLANQVLADLVTNLGPGTGENFNHNNLRYGKVILPMDADADGYHITTLLLTFFFRYMTDLIRKGHFFIAQPPHVETEEQREAGNHAVQRIGRNAARELADTKLDARKRVQTRALAREHRKRVDTDKTFVELLGKGPASRFRLIMESANQLTAEDLEI